MLMDNLLCRYSCELLMARLLENWIHSRFGRTAPELLLVGALFLLASAIHFEL